MSSHINADLYWDKSDIKSHIVDLKEFKKLVVDIKGASVIDEAIDFAQEIYDELGWDEEDYEEYYENEYEEEVRKLNELAKEDKHITAKLDLKNTDCLGPHFTIIIDDKEYENWLDYEEAEKKIKKLVNGYKVLCIKSCECTDRNSEWFGYEIDKGEKFEAYKYENGTWCLCTDFEDDWVNCDSPDIGPGEYIPIEKFDEYFKVLGKIYEECK